MAERSFTRGNENQTAAGSRKGKQKMVERISTFCFLIYQRAHIYGSCANNQGVKLGNVSGSDWGALSEEEVDPDSIATREN